MSPIFIVYGSLGVLAVLGIMFLAYVTIRVTTTPLEDDLGAFDFEPDTADDGLIAPLTFPDHAIYPPTPLILTKKPCCGPHGAVDGPVNGYVERESGEQ